MENRSKMGGYFCEIMVILKAVLKQFGVKL